MCVCVCECVREGERYRSRKTERKRERESVSARVCTLVLATPIWTDPISCNLQNPRRGYIIGQDVDNTATQELYPPWYVMLLPFIPNICPSPLSFTCCTAHGVLSRPTTTTRQPPATCFRNPRIRRRWHMVSRSRHHPQPPTSTSHITISCSRK